MAESFSLLTYVRRQFDGNREQVFDFQTVAGDRVTGTFAAWPEADDRVVVVTSANDRLHVIVVDYLGVTGGTSNWTPSATSWSQLSTTFTTSSSQTSLQVYVHGWYAQGTVLADDFSVS